MKNIKKHIGTILIIVLALAECVASVVLANNNQRMSEEISNLEQQLSSANEKIGDLEQQLADANEMISNQEQQLIAASKEISSMAKRLADASNEINRGISNRDNALSSWAIAYRLQEQRKRAKTPFEESSIDFLESLQEDFEENGIVQIISIYKDGEGGEYLLKLSENGWIRFFGQYPNKGAIVSNFRQFDNWLVKSDCPFELTDEVKSFLSQEKSSFNMWIGQEGVDGEIHMHSNGDYVLGYTDVSGEGLRIEFSNYKDDLKTEMTIQGASSPKEVYTYPYNCHSLYYLVFEYEGKVWAMTQDFTFYQLTVPASAA